MKICKLVLDFFVTITILLLQTTPVYELCCSPFFFLRIYKKMWEEQRVAAVGSIMNRYAAHLRVNHRVRLDIEGDNCNQYRAGEAPKGVVEHVERNGDTVNFSLRMEDGTLKHLSNESLKDVWEIDPDYLEEFRAAVLQDTEEESNDSEVERLYSEIEELKKSNETFRSTMSATVRHIASDLMFLSRGEPLQFSKEYADRYDLSFRGQSEASIRSQIPYKELTSDSATDISNV